MGPITSWTISGLQRGATYFFRVASSNDLGDGEQVRFDQYFTVLVSEAFMDNDMYIISRNKISSIHSSRL
jgi:hypothetical protein